MTLSDLRLTVKNQVNLRRLLGTNANYLVDRYANEAVLDVLLKTMCNVDVADSTITAGVSDYTLDTDILAVLDAYVTGADSQTRRFDQVTLADMLELRNVTSTGSVYQYAIVGNNLLLYPNPSAAGTIRFYYIPRPTEMSSDAHDPSNVAYGGIPKEYHPALEYYCLWRASEYVGSKDAPMYRQRYEEEIGDAKVAQLKRRGRLPRAQLSPSLRAVAKGPSVYP